MSWKRTLVAVSTAWMLAGQVPIHAQESSAQANLAQGVSQARAGDFFGALLSLNDVVSQLANRPQESAVLARAHAYRAAAYAGLNQPERAKAAVTLALAADPDIAVDATGFTPAVIALFAEARPPATGNPEATGRFAEQAGRFRDAFVAYLAAYHALPDPAAAADDRRLRERIITVVQKLDATPVIPADAREHAATADGLLEAEAILGSTAGASSQVAATELSKAIRSAPWWPEATFKLALVLQKLQRVDEALLNLNLYKLADPKGYAATAARATPRPTAGSPVTAPVDPGASALALIYVYWPEQQRGNKRQKVLCNEHHVADLQNNRFVVLKAAAGTHNLTFRDRDVTALVEAGREYHYRASVEGHWEFSQSPVIRLMSADAAKAEMREQDMTANDPKRTFSMECIPPAAVRGRAGR